MSETHSDRRCSFAKRSEGATWALVKLIAVRLESYPYHCTEGGGNPQVMIDIDDDLWVTLREAVVK